MARCPSCDDALTGTEHDGVAVALCNDCGATWATLDQLEELQGGPVKNELLPGKTRHRCAVCRLPLRRARLDGRVDVELCQTCRGVFFPMGALSTFKPLELTFKPSAAAGKFTCVGCKQTFALSQGTARGAGLACRKCAGLDGNTPGYEGRDLADEAAGWLQDNPLKPFQWLGNAFWILVTFLFLVVAYCGFAK
jgi:Zn-finger nucleic acid-binding protein